MAPRNQSKGTCDYCGQEITKSAVAKHLAACPQHRAAIEKADRKKAGSETLYHLHVQDASCNKTR